MMDELVISALMGETVFSTHDPAGTPIPRLRAQVGQKMKKGQTSDL
jgi:hypothetical protein